MSQHHPGRRRNGGRAASLLAPALVGGMLLASGSVAQAGPTTPAPTERAGAARQTFSAGTYLVQLDAKPVASHAKTAPAQGQRLNTRSQAVRDYLGHLKREREKVLDEVKGVKPLYTYQYVVNGFAAKLTARQAARLAGTSGVASLTRNEMRQVADAATTNTAAGATTAESTARLAETKLSAEEDERAAGSLPAPDTAEFLGLKDRKGLYAMSPGGQPKAGEGMIVGVLDTGIDTNNPSLRAFPEPRPDAEVIAKKWKGVCDSGTDAAHRVTCNNKVIGAQYFDKGVTDPTDTDWPSPMDSDSHTATTAAGDFDVSATVPDSGISGRISGLAPGARIAAYKVCWSGGCPSVDIVAGFDKAVADGVDVINFSISGGNDAPTTIPEYTAMFNAAKAGVFVSAAAGNDGPGTVSNNVPWVATVAASTHDLGYRTTITLGNGTSYEGVGISASAAPSAPLVDAARAAGGVAADQAELCKQDTLDPTKVKGAIVLCKRGDNDRVDKSAQVKALGGVGMVLYNTSPTDEQVADAHTIPTVHLDSATGQTVKAYADGSGATAELSTARAIRQQAPQIAGFSAGGVDQTSHGDLIKPDMAAPGVDIVAGTTPGGDGGADKGEQGMLSGTSMATPHVAGLALLLRSLHPHWSPMELKSALMTTATTKDTEGEPIRRAGVDGPATPLDFGAGQVVPNSAADPGLVYDSTSADWTAYSCSLGYQPVADDGSDACATARKIDPSDFNSPTISVGDLTGKQTVTRTVTNVASTTGVYTAKLQTPPGYKAVVSPKKLVVAPGGSATYKVTFTRTDAVHDTWSYGSVTLSDKDGHKVRSAVALRSVPIVVPSSVTGTGTTGSVTVTARTGWNGTLATPVNGLYAGTAKTGTLTGTDPDFGPPPSSLPASAARTEVTVPEGTSWARVAILSADHLAGSDVDLWVYDKDGNLLSNPADGNDEHADLTGPGTYEVYVNQYALPQDTTSQTYTLRTWLIGPDTKPDHPATATPAKQKASAGDTSEATVSWKDLPAGRTYLGIIDYGDGTGTVGSTEVTVTS
ncbi:S8 family serine peptidase [Streptomyces sp. NPDC058256]|uniref:S8 family serine peptidase n=1 Tax=Streptomyces sp. NPDC058256 TaxID=3346408 RepID=UPI0036E224F5